MRCFWLSLLLSLGAGGGQARAAGFDLDFFKPTTSATGTFCEENGLTLSHNHLAVDVSGGYSHQPLTLRDQRTGNAAADVVRDRLTGFLNIAYGLTDRLDVGVRMGAVIRQIGDVDVDIANDGGVPRRPRRSALGDTDLILRLAVLAVDGPQRRFRLTLTAPLAIPTGTSEALSGSGRFSFRPRLTAGWQSEGLSGAVSVGFMFRSGAEVPGSTLLVGNAVTGGLGLSYALIPRRIWMQAEASAMVGVVLSNSGSVGGVASQVILGPRAALPGGVLFQVGVGTGLNRAAGSPRVAAILAVARTWTVP